MCMYVCLLCLVFNGLCEKRETDYRSTKLKQMKASPSSTDAIVELKIHGFRDIVYKKVDFVLLFFSFLQKMSSLARETPRK